ncbi:hypothetical protein BDC45DRAFT_540100 [Circinella umbellata]|nr:hypothetical protein BDC45DRAFT_540100 [Circinella umbellata]
MKENPFLNQSFLKDIKRSFVPTKLFSQNKYNFKIVDINFKILNTTEIFSNLIQKLPNQECPSHVGEMELIVNFLDPILSPICHRPNTDKLLIWLNRQDENTLMLKPDAVMMAMPQKKTDITLGYVKVKPKDSLSNPELDFIDLVRLGTFGRTLMLRKSNRKAIVV